MANLDQVNMRHPDLDGNEISVVSIESFESVYREKGWIVVDDDGQPISETAPTPPPAPAVVAPKPTPTNTPKEG